MSFTISHRNKQLRYAPGLHELHLLSVSSSNIMIKHCRLESVLGTNKQLIECRLAVTEQLITFVKICGELRQQMNKLETLIAEERQHWDMTVLEQSR